MEAVNALKCKSRGRKIELKRDVPGEELFLKLIAVQGGEGKVTELRIYDAPCQGGLRLSG